MKHYLAAIVWVMLFFGSAAMAADHGVMIHDPWVREAPPNMKMSAGYVSIMNHGTDEKVLVGVSSPQFARVEMHRTEMQGDMAKMIAQDNVAIPAGKTVKFEPGGLHLMLIEPVKSLKLGDKVELSLTFKNGISVKANAVVKKGGSMHQHHEHKH